MKKLLSLVLTLLMIASSFAFTTLSVGAATESVFNYGFVSSETKPTGFNTYNIHFITESIGGNASGVGYYDGADTTATDTNPNRFDASGFKTQNNSTGLWIFETDMYIPSSGIPADSKIQILTGALSGSWSSYYTTTLQPGSATAELGVVPEQEWFKLQFEFDYLPEGTTNDTLSVYSIVSGSLKTKVATFSISDTNWAANGFNRIRISIGSSKIYLDNMKYYQERTTEKSPYKLSDTADVHYAESFDLSHLYNLTSLAASTTYGNFTSRSAYNATFETTDDPTDATNKVLHVKTATDTAWSENPAMDIKTAGYFEEKLTGTQVVEAKYYIPSIGKNAELASDKYSSAAITLSLFSKIPSGVTGYEVSFWGGRVAQLRLGRHSSYSYTGTSSNYSTYGVYIPSDKWVTARFILNYNNGTIEYQVEYDGNLTTIGVCAMPAALKTYPVAGILFGKADASVEYYIDDMVYYETDNMPSEINFEKELSVTTATGYTVGTGNATVELVQAPADTTTHGKAVKISATALEESPSAVQQIVNFDTRLYPIGATSGISQFDVDLYFPKAFAGSDERVSIVLNTDNLMEVDSSAVGVSFNPNDGASLTSNVRIFGDGIGDEKIEYPIGEWFTIRFTYNINTNLSRSDLIKADGTSININECKESSTFASYAKEHGVKRLRVQYYKPAKMGLPEDVEFYIDNIKFSNAVWGDISLADNGTYTASVEYSAQGEVVTNTKLMLAQYNTAGELVAVNIYTPTFADGAGTYTADNIAKASSATKAKLIYWDSLGGVTPLAVAAE